MTRITVLGATGFAGSHIAREATARGHELTLVARSPQDDVPEGATVVQGSVVAGSTVVGEELDEAVAAAAIDGAEVVVAALSPRGDMAGRVAGAYEAIGARVAAAGGRLIVIGGYGSLRDADGERIATTPAFGDEYRPEALELLEAFERIRAIEGLDWTYVSPAGSFGAFMPDQIRTGTYRIGGDTPLVDADGVSTITGPDFAIGVVDEIEAAAHLREHITFAA